MSTNAFSVRALSALALIVLAVQAHVARAETTTWTGSGDAVNWSDPANWSGGLPGNGTDVVINAGSVLLTASTPELSSLTMGGGTLTFSNWTTRLLATNVWINGGTVTHALCATNVAISNTNRVWISCTNLFVAASGAISANGCGYPGATNSWLPGYGPGGGSGSGSGYTPAGGSYGGKGRAGAGGTPAQPGFTYGSASDPNEPGSGGGCAWGDAGVNKTVGGSGGGAIRIEASGTATINGSVMANGTNSTGGSYGGGGSGGSINIQCGAFAGTNGLVQANGGRNQSSTTSGTAGGGRIAVHYSTLVQPATVRVEARPALDDGHADIGTMHFSDSQLLTETLTNSISGQVLGFSSWSPSTLTVSNTWVRFAEPGFQLKIGGDLTVNGSGTKLEIGGESYWRKTMGQYSRKFSDTLAPPLLDVAGGVLLTNGGSLYVYAAATNTPDACGALVSVTGAVVIATNSWLYPSSNPTNGGSVLIRLRDLKICASTNSGIYAKGAGYAGGHATFTPAHHGYGPGGGKNGSAGGAPGGGAGCGGTGGTSTAYGTAAGGVTYGSSNAPVDPGSGGGAYNSTEYSGGPGGGLVRIEAQDTVDVQGLINADGEPHSASDGGASGGGIFIKCRTFSGAGALSAAGSSGNAGGGGGRISIWRGLDTFSGTISVTNGTGSGPGGTGTVAKIDRGPAVANHEAANITASSADQVGELVSTGQAPCRVYCYWGLTNGATDKGNWATNDDLGTRDPGWITNAASPLAPASQYFYRFYATNEYGDYWATSSLSFSTMGAGAVNNGAGATNRAATSVTLQGDVTSGNPTPEAYFCWGASNPGGNDTSLWEHVVSKGAVLGPISLDLTGLLANKTYYYRCYVTNDYGGAWALDATNFVTESPTLAIGSAQVIEGNSPTTTNCVFAVTLSATSAVDVTVGYAAADGTATEAGSDYDPASGTLTVLAGQVSTSITVVVNGDELDEYPSEIFYVNLSDPTNATIAAGQGQGLATIVDDDDVNQVRRWNGTGNWTNSANWTPVGYPSPLDDAVVESGSAVLIESAAVKSVTVTNAATLVFSNWLTRLTAADVMVASGGVVTLPAAFTNNGPSNRIWIACTSLTVAAGGTIDAEGKGYLGGQIQAEAGHGPGAGSGSQSGNTPAGAGYGGKGSHGSAELIAGYPYGSASEAGLPGSGGGCGGYGTIGGPGGGAIRIEAVGGVTVNGLITANGGNSSGAYGGGGSGGGIYLSCQTLAGSSGTIRANGGSSTATGDGGGGRIAIHYDGGAQALAPIPSVQLLTMPAAGEVNDNTDIGSIYLTDGRFITSPLTTNISGQIYGVTSWTTSDLIASNAWIRFVEDGFTLTVSNDLVVCGAANKLEFGANRYWTNVHPTVTRKYSDMTAGPTVSVGGNLIATNGGRLMMYSASTNSGGPNYGALLGVTGDVVIATNSWIYLGSHPSTGGSPLFRMRNLWVLTGGAGIDASASGYAGGSATPSHHGYGTGGGRNGPYGGAAGAGGGYGGLGGTVTGYGTAAGGTTYGYSNAPVEPGSGGGAYNIGSNGGGAGGGLVRIEASAAVTVNGTIAANGQVVAANNGGGAGGAILIRCRTLDGTGTVLAKGADASAAAGGGGGGRVAVWYGRMTEGDAQLLLSGMTVPYIAVTNAYPAFAGTVSAPGGLGADPGSIGTVIFLKINYPSPGVIMMIR